MADSRPATQMDLLRWIAGDIPRYYGGPAGFEAAESAGLIHWEGGACLLTAEGRRTLDDQRASTEGGKEGPA